MKKLILSLLFLCGSAIAQPPWFPYGVPIGEDGGGCGAACQAAISDSLSEAIRDGSQNITVDSVRANWISGDVICDSACQSTIGGGEGLLYKDVLSEITSLPPGSVGQVLQSRGGGLPPVFANPATVSAIVYGPGSDLVGNPSPINPDAKYIRVTDTARIVAGSAFADNLTLIDGDSRYMAVEAVAGITEYTAGTSAADVIRGIAYGAGIYVRVGNTGLIETSPELVTWTTRTSGTTNQLNDVTFAYGKFWVVGSAGTMLSSPDGITWTPVALPGTVASDDLTSIATDGSGVIIVANPSGGYRQLQSLDSGATWTTGGMGSSSGLGAFSAYYDGTYFILGRNVSGGVSSVTYSDNVATGSWQEATLSCGGGIIFSITDNGTTRLISGDAGCIATSPKSLPPATANWTRRTSPSTGLVRAYAMGSAYYAVSGTSITLVSSNNGATWFTGPARGTSEAMIFAVRDPGNPARSILGGNAGVMRIGVGPIVYSAGNTAAVTLRGIAYGAGTYVRVGDAGTIETSPDLKTWTTRTSGTTSQLNYVIYDAFTARFWVVGNAGVVRSSPTGVTWTAATLPGTVSADNLAMIATNGSGAFIVANSSVGNRNMVSLDGGVTWTVNNLGDGAQTLSVGHSGNTFITGRASSSGARVITYSSNIVAGLWATTTIPGTAENISSIISDGTNWIISGTTGLLATCPRNVAPTAGNWTVHATGTTQSLRVFTANGYAYAIGGPGTPLVSVDNGVTWGTGPAIGTTNFMIFGMADPAVPNRIIVVGASGTMRIGSTSLTIAAYATESDRSAKAPPIASQFLQYTDLPATVTFSGEVSFDLDTLTANNIPLNIDALRQFKSTAYASTADRTADTNPLGSALYTYSETPLVVTIPGQIVFQIGVLTPADVPFDFDVYTFQDLIYAGLIVQNPSLNPGPYYCYNCVYDFGPDDRFEYGPESSNQYATVLIQNSTTGNFYFLRSATDGDGGDPITWDTLMTITNQGVSMLPSTQVVANADITVEATASQVVTSVSLTAARTATLQDPSVYGGNRCIDFIDGGYINGANTLAIDPASATIDGASGPISLSAAYESLSICTDNSATEWIVRYSK